MIRITAVNGIAASENLEEFDARRQLLVLTSVLLRRLKTIEGKVDYEKMNKGNYVLMAGFLSDKR